jgi:hypothetical protein
MINKSEYAKVKKITFFRFEEKLHPPEKRIICISDIHGELGLFKRLLEKVNYNANDVLVLLGDLYTKGTQCHETLKYLIALSQNKNVHPLRGNTDWVEDYLSPQEALWLENLPDIIDAGDYIFVHSGLESPDLAAHRPAMHKKYNTFMETAPAFDRWVIAGHWPTAMYCHQIPNANPIINHEKKIIAIDGGNVLKFDGQLNALIIHNNQFSFESVDNLPTHRIIKPQEASGGHLSITWNDRFIEIIEDGEKLCRIKHLESNTLLTVPKSQIWTDSNNNTVICDGATDYHLPVNEGDEVSVVEAFPDRIFAKKDGVSGWIKI